MSLLTRLSAEDLALLTVILALALADDQGAEELDLLGNFLVAVGGIMLVMSSQKGIVDAQKADKTSEHDTIQQLKQRLEKLEAANGC